MYFVLSVILYFFLCFLLAIVEFIFFFIICLLCFIFYRLVVSFIFYRLRSLLKEKLPFVAKLKKGAFLSWLIKYTGPWVLNVLKFFVYFLSFRSSWYFSYYFANTVSLYFYLFFPALFATLAASVYLYLLHIGFVVIEVHEPPKKDPNTVFLESHEFREFVAKVHKALYQEIAHVEVVQAVHRLYFYLVGLRETDERLKSFVAEIDTFTEPLPRKVEVADYFFHSPLGILRYCDTNLQIAIVQNYRSIGWEKKTTYIDQRLFLRYTDFLHHKDISSLVVLERDPVFSALYFEYLDILRTTNIDPVTAKRLLDYLLVKFLETRFYTTYLPHYVLDAQKNDELSYFQWGVYPDWRIDTYLEFLEYMSFVNSERPFIFFFKSDIYRGHYIPEASQALGLPLDSSMLTSLGLKNLKADSFNVFADFVGKPVIHVKREPEPFFYDPSAGLEINGVFRTHRELALNKEPFYEFFKPSEKPFTFAWLRLHLKVWLKQVGDWCDSSNSRDGSLGCGGGSSSSENEILDTGSDSSSFPWDFF